MTSRYLPFSCHVDLVVSVRVWLSVQLVSEVPLEQTKKRQRSVSGDMGPTWSKIFSLLILHPSSPFLFVLSFLKTENWPGVAGTIPTAGGDYSDSSEICRNGRCFWRGKILSAYFGFRPGLGLLSDIPSHSTMLPCHLKRLCSCWFYEFYAAMRLKNGFCMVL